MKRKEETAHLSCRTCRATYEAAVTPVSAAIDVYTSWLDAGYGAGDADLQLQQQQPSVGSLGLTALTRTDFTASRAVQQAKRGPAPLPINLPPRRDNRDPTNPTNRDHRDGRDGRENVRKAGELARGGELTREARQAREGREAREAREARDERKAGRNKRGRTRDSERGVEKPRGKRRKEAADGSAEEDNDFDDEERLEREEEEGANFSEHDDDELDESESEDDRHGGRRNRDDGSDSAAEGEGLAPDVELEITADDMKRSDDEEGDEVDEGRPDDGGDLSPSGLGGTQAPTARGSRLQGTNTWADSDDED